VGNDLALEQTAQRLPEGFVIASELQGSNRPLVPVGD
jgi:hypothetical protein